MEIKYLKSLRDNPTKKGVRTNKPLSIDEILALEHKYNNGQTFPTALRELLYLAGTYCIIFDSGNNDNQQELQEEAREILSESNHKVLRPFYALEVRDSEMFLFVYLDEGNDPIMHQVIPYLNDHRWNRSTELTLTQFCDLRIERVKKGENPF